MPRDEPQIAQAVAVSKQIAADIVARTGLSCIHVDGIDTSKKDVAVAVLPILIEWLPRAKSLPSLRHAIFSRFDTPYARPYFEFLEDCWEKEDYIHAQHSLMQVLAHLVDEEHADHLWSRAVELKRTSGLQLMASLARFQKIKSEVIPELLCEMDNPARTAPELMAAASVEDPRILRWFKEHAMSSNKELRKIAQRVITKKGKLPDSVRYSAEGPDRRREIFSTEVDADKLPATLKEISERFHCKPRILAKPFSFVGRLDIDRWLLIDSTFNGDPPFRIWVRLEDFDTVELVATRSDAASMGLQTPIV